MSRIVEQFNKTVEIALKNDFYKNRVKKINELKEIKNFKTLQKNDLLALTIDEQLQGNTSLLYEYHESSGSTNIPFMTWFTQSDFMAYVKQINESPIKFNSKDIVLVRFPYALSVPAHTFSKTVHMNGGCVIHAGRGDSNCTHEKVIEILMRTKATIFACNVQEAFILGEIAKKKGLNLPKDFALRAICTAGELFTDSRKKRLEKLWGVPVFNFYGTTELGNLATTDKDAILNASKDHFYFEVLDENTGEEVPDGTKGILHVTTFSKECFPFIRFNTGDIVVKNKDVLQDKIQLKHFGRITERIECMGKKITFGELQNEFLSLPEELAGNFFKIRKTFNEIEIIVESDCYNEISGKEIKLNIDIPYRVSLVKKSMIMNLDSYINQEVIGKPKYILKGN
ncbi:AMP-binding protein [Clostridium sp. SHJSY1]|uniref:phenylacetate--CoA ligase family protein n=1 Tax=Clostridium sp. SHJSY1 TaxID=2942483 RepID=UPI0028750CF6|nr:AMP-binding protein [Clostridium sp. SHJSY1]MDS0527101.1 AMP-binding protein [Clostridium sp. SHJSY1]